jgi:trimeric autotransporter adhesin
MATNNTINANSTTPLGVAIGGTGANTLTIHGLLKGDAAGAVSALPAATDGQIPIGSTSSDPVLGTITAGAGINVSNGAGTITITATGGSGISTLVADDTNTATGSTVTIAGDTSNIFTTANNASKLTISQGPQLVLPATNAALNQGVISVGGTVMANFINGSNAFIGSSCGNGTTGQIGNVAVGLACLTSIANGTENIALGVNALATMDNGSNNIALGHNACTSLNSNTGNYNIGIGNGALSSLATGAANVAIGLNAGAVLTGSESSNIYFLNNGVTGESNTIRIGTQGNTQGLQDVCYIAGIAGVTLGGSPDVVTIDTSTGQLGVAAFPAGVTTIAGNTGTATGSTITFDATSLAGSSTAFTASGSTVQFSVEDTNVNTYVGNLSGNLTGTGGQNTGFGHGTMLAFTTGVANTAIGYNALLNNTSSGLNVALGNGALQNLATGSGINTAIGTGSLVSLTSGTNNIALGNNAGAGYVSTESNNIIIGTGGTPGDSATTRLGNFSTQTKCFVAGVAGITVLNTAAVLIDTTTGQLGTILSSEKFKHNVKDMGDKSDAVMQLRPVTFSYKGDVTNSMQYGLIAEEVATVMPQIVTYDAYGNPYTVRYHELPSILLNEIQKLSKRVEQLEAQLAAKV